MSEQILTESSNPNTNNIDLMNGEQIAALINQEDMKVATAITSQVSLIGQAIELIADAFKQKGRLGYFGAGTSGRIGILDASECPPTYGTNPSMVQGFIAGGEKAITHSVEAAEDSIIFATEDINTFAPTNNDIVVAVSASGNPVYTLEVLRLAQQQGAKTIAITTNPKAKFKTFADIFICAEVGAEAITGSTRMKSGTAQKMILNMLTTGAMIRLGKTYHNLMIDMRPTNDKLKNRAKHIVSDICHIDFEAAEEFLKKSNHNVKLACIMAIKHYTLEQAEQILEQHHGLLRSVIGDNE